MCFVSFRSLKKAWCGLGLSVVLAAGHGDAASLGVNFVAANQGGGTAMAPTDSAGVEPQVNWNNMPATQTQTTPVPTVDDSGNPTTVTLTWTANTTWRATANAATIPLFDGYLDDTSLDLNSHVQVEGIAYPLYDVYLYFGSDGNDRTCWLQINSDETNRKYARTASNPFPGYIEATAISEATATSATYARFSDVSGSSLFIEWNRLSNNSGLHGFQIVSRQVVPGLPEVVTLPATNLTANAAELVGEITDPGTNAPTVTLYYGPTDGTTATNAWAHQALLPGTHTGRFSTFVRGLDPKTVYYYRARAANQAGQVWARASQSFQTLALPASVQNLPASGILAFSAQVGAQVGDTGGQTPRVTVHYGTTDGGTNTAAWNSQVDMGTLSDAGTVMIRPLEGGRTYFHRARAVNEAGVSWAPQSASFNTPLPTLPTLENRPASHLTGTSAKLNGQVIDHGFDPPFIILYYGRTDGGTIREAWESSVPLGVQAAAFSRTVGNLSPLTPYFFRAHAQNAAGQAWAPVSSSFVTPDYAPPAVLINEIHYDEADKTIQSEFIELYNPDTNAVDLSDWQLADAVDYTFPAGATLGPGHYLVVARHPPTIASKFGVGALGPWSGKLRNRGDTIVLRDAAGEKVDEVDYRLGFPWPTVGDPPSYSIELYHPQLDNELGGSWHRSDGSFTAPPPGTYVPANSSWRYFKGTREPSPTPDAWRSLAFDDSSWLTGHGSLGYGEDFIVTPLADMQGAYSTVYFRKTFTIDNPAALSSLILGVQFDDGFNVWINGTLVAHSSNTTGNEPFNATVGNIGENYDYLEYTVGNPAALLRPGTNLIAAQIINTSLADSSDCFFDARLTDRPAISSGTGPTPGARNSVFTLNAPPQLRQVDHLPKEPTSGQDVLITVKVTDPDGVAAVTLAYQLVNPGDYFCRWLLDSVPDPRYEDPTEWTELPMADDGLGGDVLSGDDLYTATIPGDIQTHRRLVRYRILATDSEGVSVRAPYPDDDQPNFAYFVYDGVPAWTGRVRPGEGALTFTDDLMGSIATYHLLSTSNWVADSQFGGYGGSSYRWPGTLVYDGAVYDHIRYRPRGGVHRFQYGKNFWKFDFHRGRYFQARDPYGRPYQTTWHKLNFSSIVQQVGFGHRGEQGLFEGVGFRLFELAGVPAPKTHYVQFRVIDQADEFGPNQYEGDYYGLFLAIEQLDGQFLDEHDLPDGNLYKIEGYSGTSNNQGPTQVSDRSDVSSFINTYRNSSPDETWWRNNLHLDSYYSYRTIVEGIHHYDIAYGKNYFYYHHPETGRFQILPWDIDLTWANNMYGSGEHDFKIKVAQNPAFNRDYQNRMREIMDLLYNPDQAGMLIDETVQTVYAPGTNTLVEADRRLWDNNPRINHPDRYYDIAASQDFAGMIQVCRNYVVSRGAWMRNTILLDEPQIPATPTVKYLGPPGFPANGLTFFSSPFSSPVGDAFAAIQWRIAQVTEPDAPDFDPSLPRRYEIETSWDSGALTTFADQITIPSFVARPGDRYRVRVRHRDASGRWSHWSNPVRFLAGLADVQVYTNALMITEVMYKPSPASVSEEALGFSTSDFEFIELKNVGDTPLDLAPLRFTKGVDFDFTNAVLSTLAPQGHVLVVRRLAAFLSRYGTGLPVAGEYYASQEDNLDNAGERLKLSLGAGTPVQDFVYDDAPPWPSSPDVEGTSLVLIDPDARPDHTRPENWRGSAFQGGSPGTDESMNLAFWKSLHFTAAELADPAVSGDFADADEDGADNVREYMRGTNPRDGMVRSGAQGILYLVDGQAHLAIRFTRPVGAADLDFQIRISENLTDWRVDPAATVMAEPAFQHGDGTETVILRDVFPASSTPHRYLQWQVIRLPRW